ncbi:MAG: hypothetical protein WAW96_17830 [Alphaproteobacteria bacterium]
MPQMRSRGRPESSGTSTLAARTDPEVPLGNVGSLPESSQTETDTGDRSVVLWDEVNVPEVAESAENKVLSKGLPDDPAAH